MWWHSPLAPVRQLAKTIKGVITLGYFDHPKARQQLEYVPNEWMADVKQKRLARFSPEIEEHEKAVTAPDPLVTPGMRAKSRINAEPT
jgi:hypothetical protein